MLVNRLKKCFASLAHKKNKNKLEEDTGQLFTTGHDDITSCAPAVFPGQIVVVSVCRELERHIRH